MKRVQKKQQTTTELRSIYCGCIPHYISLALENCKNKFLSCLNNEPEEDTYKLMEESLYEDNRI